MLVGDSRQASDGGKARLGGPDRSLELAAKVRRGDRPGCDSGSSYGRLVF